MNIKKVLVGAAAGAVMFGVMVVPAFAAAPNWNTTGTWNFDLNSTVWGGVYSKTMTITQDLSGNITGTGNNVPGNTWNVAGNVSGNAINFSLNYNAPMSGYVASFIGNIKPDGTMNGTWLDVLYSDSGLWYSTSGVATAIVNLPTSKDQCKKGGWETFGVFKNQGDCVSFVVTGGKNLPANP